MSIKQLKTYTYLRTRIKELNAKRVKDDDPETYRSAKEAMLQLHIDWNTLTTAVKTQDIDKQASLAALNLAASALKFVADLGNITEMGL